MELAGKPTPPREGETSQEFFSRCMSVLAKEHPEQDQDQRAATCYSILRKTRPSALPKKEDLLQPGKKHLTYAELSSKLAGRPKEILKFKPFRVSFVRSPATRIFFYVKKGEGDMFDDLVKAFPLSEEDAAAAKKGNLDAKDALSSLVKWKDEFPTEVTRGLSVLVAKAAEEKQADVPLEKPVEKPLETPAEEQEEEQPSLRDAVVQVIDVFSQGIALLQKAVGGEEEGGEEEVPAAEAEIKEKKGKPKEKASEVPAEELVGVIGDALDQAIQEAQTETGG